MNALSIQQAFDLAVQHHQAGRLPQAEQLYRQILAHQPRHARALQHLGVIAHQMGRNDAALDLIRQAIALEPNSPEAHSNLGNVFLGMGRTEEALAAWHRAIALNPNVPEARINLANLLQGRGELDQAIAAYRRAISLQPDYAEAHRCLGNALRAKGQIDEAIAAFHQAIALSPDFVEAYRNLGAILHEKGCFAEAIACYRRLLALSPDDPEAHNNLGAAYWRKGQLDEAIACHQRALALKPGFAGAYNNLGNAWGDKEQFDQAIACYQRALDLNPNDPQTHTNLGTALHDQGKLDDAIAQHRKAILLSPDSAAAHFNLGNALRDCGRLDEAISAYHACVALKPDFPEAHFSLAWAMLLRGNFETGWPQYEWRWKCSGTTPRPFSQPLWNRREPTKGKTILLHAEQGFGDAIQFLRYVPLLASLGANVVLEIPAELKTLAERLAGVYRLVERGHALPPFDMYCPLLSLPWAFETTLESIPANVPYLFPDPNILESWRRKPALAAPGLKVALAWAGNPGFKHDRSRSIALDRLFPLAEVQGVNFYSIQKGSAERQADHPPAGLRLINLSPELHDFADTAAVMSLMDLVITTDTAVAHLAGALARPVWAMLQFVPDWRWLLDRQDSPWYPTMRLFRQSTPGDWPGLIAKIVQALKVFRPSEPAMQ